MRTFKFTLLALSGALFTISAQAEVLTFKADNASDSGHTFSLLFSYDTEAVSFYEWNGMLSRYHFTSAVATLDGVSSEFDFGYVELVDSNISNGGDFDSFHVFAGFPTGTFNMEVDGPTSMFTSMNLPTSGAFITSVNDRQFYYTSETSGGYTPSFTLSQVSAVPEPSTSLVALGLLGSCLSTRLRRKTATL